MTRVRVLVPLHQVHSPFTKLSQGTIQKNPYPSSPTIITLHISEILLMPLTHQHSHFVTTLDLVIHSFPQRKTVISLTLQ